MKLTRSKFGLLAAIVGLLLYWVLRNDVFLPVRFTLEYVGETPGHVSIYLDTGAGFNESEHKLFTSSRFRTHWLSTDFQLELPVKNLRLDPGIRPQEVNISAFCLDSLIRRYCWQGGELAHKLNPANDIESVSVTDQGVRIVTRGIDPYLIFDSEFARVYLQHARLPRLLSVSLAIFIPVLLMVLFSLLKPWALQTLHRFLQFQIRLNWLQGLALFVLISLVFSGNWLQLDQAARAVWVVFLLLMACFALAPGWQPKPLGLCALFRGISGDGFWVAGAAVLVATAPVFGLLALTWNQEFPYVGDQHFHLEIDRATYHLVWHHARELWWLLGTLILCLFLGWMRMWLLAVSVLFIFWSFTEDVAPYFVRYPGAGRFLASPFFYLAENYHWDSLLNAARLANAVSVLVWLLVLRPLIVRRWPDWVVMPVAAAFFFQTEVAYYFTTSYLEAWSLIFVLLAVENQIRFSGDPVRTGISMLLIGFAAIVKEAAIFMLPVVWLASMPWRHGAQHFARSCVAGVAAALPFIIYFAIRSHFGERPFRMVSLSDFVTTEKLIETYHQFHYHLGVLGLVLCLVLLFWLIFNTTRHRQRASALMLLGGALIYLIYNYLEATSIGYAGYTRYYLLPFMLLCAGLFLLERTKMTHLRPLVLSTVTLLAVFMNAQILIPYLLQSSGNDALRNFTEHYDAPVFFPINALVSQADASGELEAGDRIVINNPLGWGMPSIGLNYPNLARKFKLVVASDTPCICDEEKRVVLQPFVYFGGLNEHLRDPELRHPRQQFPKPHFYRIWSDHHHRKPACLRSMRVSCDTVFEVSEQGETLGILGIR